ncbi:hypothetical protein G5714_000143 [Onychostoma macrolepis]|uniref:Uncharacterized protein n=1 Tax=Onychostoma macrolepis TaxID=369639 RepID=A0A7J6DFL1_9TELE|nr:hypothetical protein G5714_000143 [Onychostoma macrolepis]
MSLYVKREDEDTASKLVASPSSGSNCVSMKSDQSMRNHLLEISEGTVTSDSSIIRKQRTESPEPSGVSVKTDRSMEHPFKFSDGPVTSDSSLV